MRPASGAREALLHHRPDRQEHTMTTAAMTANAATVAGLYEAFGRGDLPSILDRLADDVSWDGDWADHSAQRGAGAPLLQPRRGVADVAGFFAALAECTMNDFQVLDIIGSGRQVVAELRVDISMPGGGRIVDEELHLWTFDDTGKVVRFRHYVDTAKHLAAAGGTDTTVG
jgi:ketosteroid isomerase-like protein